MKNGVCPKCDGRRVAHLETVLDQSDMDTQRELAKFPTGEKLLFGRVFAGIGVEAYVCTDCGYFEEYAREPDKIPWDDVAGLTWVPAGEDGDS